jgi:hypothetical protein
MAARATKATPSARARTRKPRRNWRAAFLEGFTKTGTVTGGCAHAGIHRSSAYRERQRSESFALKWADIDEEVTDRLEATALLLALKGEVRLIEFLLKARRPDVYREQHVLEHTGPGGGPVELIELGLDLTKLTDAELRSLQRLVTRASPAEPAPTPLAERIWWEKLDRAIARKGPEGQKIRHAWSHAILEVHCNAAEKLELVGPWGQRRWQPVPPERCSEEYVEAERRRLTDEMGRALDVGAMPR